MTDKMNSHDFSEVVKMKSVRASKTMHFLKIILFFVFIAGIAVIGLYPVKNQNVTLKVFSDSSNATKSFTSDQVASLTSFELEFPEIHEKKITGIWITRLFKSVAVDKIPLGAIENYAQVQNDRIVFNDKACKLLLENSKSAVMERIFFAEIWLAVVMLVMILLNALHEKLNPENHDNHGPVFELKKFFSQIVRYGRYMIYAANADLKAEVANSYLNRLWWLLEPFFNMMVYVIVFGRVMGNSIQNYATFVFSALLMWNYFNKTVNYSVKCIRMNRDIVTKVYIPKHVLLITDMILNFFKLLFSLLVLIPMLIIFHVHVGPAILWIVPAYILMILLSFGVGMIFMHYGVYVDDLAYAVGILLQMFMFLSGVFYDVITSLPKPLNVVMLCLNPISMFMDAMRVALLNNIVCNVPLVLLWTLISVLLSYMGIHIVYKNENSYVKVV